jgi:hypothetical protein
MRTAHACDMTQASNGEFHTRQQSMCIGLVFIGQCHDRLGRIPDRQLLMSIRSLGLACGNGLQAFFACTPQQEFSFAFHRPPFHYGRNKSAGGFPLVECDGPVRGSAELSRKLHILGMATLAQPSQPAASGKASGKTTLTNGGHTVVSSRRSVCCPWPLSCGRTLRI